MTRSGNNLSRIGLMRSENSQHPRPGVTVLEKNPADVPSRGLTPLKLFVNTLRRNGPDWLRNGEGECNQDDPAMPDKCTTEMRSADRKLVHSLLNTDSTTGLKQIIKIEKYSSFS